MSSKPANGLSHHLFPAEKTSAIEQQIGQYHLPHHMAMIPGGDLRMPQPAVRHDQVTDIHLNERCFRRLRRPDNHFQLPVGELICQSFPDSGKIPASL